MFWTAIQKFGITGMSFLANIVLARQLTPADYGIIGMLAIFTAVSTTFVDGGFGSALIQKKEPTQKDFSTILYLNSILSVVFYAILFFSAPFISEFYNMPILCDVLRVIGVTLIINALSYVQSVKLRKEMQFKKLARVYLCATLVSFGVAIILAYRGFGVWSLVWMNITITTVTSILLWIVGNWHPSAVFSKESVKTLFGFGSFLLLSNLINTICNNIQGLIIGKLFSASDMGYYSQAKKLDEIPATSISSIIDTVSYPLMAAKQDNMVEYVAVVSKFIRIIACVTFPIMTLLIILGRPLIVFLYTDKWIEAVPYFQILCIGGMAVCLQSINYNAVAALGKSKILFKWTFIKRGLGLIFVICGSFFGIFYLMWGTVAAMWTLYLCNSYVLSKCSSYKMSSQCKDLGTILALCGVSFIICQIWCFTLTEGIFNFLLQGLTFIFLYIVLVRYKVRDTYDGIMSILLNKFRK